MSTISCSELMSRFCNGVSVNLWHYLNKIRHDLLPLSDPSAIWTVRLVNVAFTEHRSTFTLILELADKRIELDHIDHSSGYADGRIQIRKDGLWLDISNNGGIASELAEIDTIVIDKRYITTPPPMRSGKTFTLKVGSGLTAIYASTNMGDKITIGVDRSYLSSAEEIEDRGILTINGASPVDGDITIRGVGAFEVDVVSGEVS